MESETDTAAIGAAYYGYLFEPDKKPTQVLDALLRSIASYTVENIGEKNDQTLSPAKLAAFYKTVGGSYDALFVNVPHPSISYIYQAIGCQHSLQPTGNDFEAPSIPALTTRGFVRWVCIETLLGPEEHAAYLQFAVQHFGLKHPDTGEPFPLHLPREAFPSQADPDIERWHSRCAEKLKQEAKPDESDAPDSRPSLPPKATLRSGYTHLRAGYASGRSPRERQQGADYFSTRPVAYQHVPSSTFQPVRPPVTRDSTRRTRLTPGDESPRTSRARRKSVPDYSYPLSPVPQSPVSFAAPRRGLQPRTDSYIRRHSHPRVHRRPSTSSTSSSGGNNGSPSSHSESDNPPPSKARRKGPPHTQSSISNLRFPAGVADTPGPASSMPPPPYPARSQGEPAPKIRVDPGLANYKVPIDLSGKLSAPFMQSSRASSRATTPVRSDSRGKHLWYSGDDVPDRGRGSGDVGRSGDDSNGRERRRQEGGQPRSGSGRSGSLEERRRSRDSIPRSRDLDRDRERDRIRGRGDSYVDRDDRDGERRRERRRYVPDGVR
ncbi:MAG: hypothetical protein M1818_003854 [Claussenomyces sp. TS43310]|nr:MAG: hypothetical protein M1818_003854 [Claussenomyces sp. TS43310]